VQEFLDSIPDYAKDLKLNLSSVLRQAELTEQQTWGAALACAMASRGPKVLAAIAEEAKKHLSDRAAASAKAAVAVMGMNNILYRFRHYAGNPRYGEIPARLRMQAIRTHGGDPADFELCCIAVSAINGCEVCIAAHEKSAREKGLTEEQVMASIRIASTIYALAAVMESESAGVEQPASA
jgi:alkyl hydroperoxide reductase subunit D